MASRHLDKDQWNDHLIQDGKPCFKLEAANPMYGSDDAMEYIVSTSLPILRGKRWSAIAKKTGLLSDQTVFARDLRDKLCELIGVTAMVAPGWHKGKDVILIWVTSDDPATTFCNPSVSELLQGMPNMVWATVELVTHQYSSRRQRFLSLLQRI